VTAAVATGSRPARFSLGGLARTGAAVWIVVLVAVAALSIVDGARFWAVGNVANILTAMVVLGIAALGQHLVVLSGGIDLSVGSTATLSALLTALLINGYPIRTVPVIIGVLLVGAVIGVVQGLLVARLHLPPFIVTLATFYLIQGVAFLISTTPTGRVTRTLASLGLDRIGPVPYSFAVLVVVLAVVAFLLYRTAYGRRLFAVGGDQAAARANGVPVSRVLVIVYVLAGVLAALAGVLLAARATVGSPTAGQGLELSAITVVVLGGTSLLGGRGTLVGTMGGVVLLSLVSSSVTLLQLPATLTDLIRGVVILAAAAVFVTKGRR
jgi:ribose transport system permease protein